MHATNYTARLIAPKDLARSSGLEHLDGNFRAYLSDPSTYFIGLYDEGVGKPPNALCVVQLQERSRLDARCQLPVCSIPVLSVAKGHRRQGMGTCVVQSAIELAKKSGLQGILARCTIPASVPFWWAMGFRPVVLQVDLYVGTPPDVDSSIKSTGTTYERTDARADAGSASVEYNLIEQLRAVDPSGESAAASQLAFDAGSDRGLSGSRLDSNALTLAPVSTPIVGALHCRPTTKGGIEGARVEPMSDECNTDISRSRSIPSCGNNYGHGHSDVQGVVDGHGHSHVHGDDGHGHSHVHGVFDGRGDDVKRYCVMTLIPGIEWLAATEPRQVIAGSHMALVWD